LNSFPKKFLTRLFENDSSVFEMRYSLKIHKSAKILFRPLHWKMACQLSTIMRIDLMKMRNKIPQNSSKILTSLHRYIITSLYHYIATSLHPYSLSLYHLFHDLNHTLNNSIPQWNFIHRNEYLLLYQIWPKDPIILLLPWSRNYDMTWQILQAFAMVKSKRWESSKAWRFARLMISSWYLRNKNFCIKENYDVIRKESVI